MSSNDIFTKTIREAKTTYLLLSFLMEVQDKTEFDYPITQKGIESIKEIQKTFESDLNEIAMIINSESKSSTILEAVELAIQKVKLSGLDGFPVAVFFYRIESDGTFASDWFYREFWKYWFKTPMPECVENISVKYIQSL